MTEAEAGIGAFIVCTGRGTHPSVEFTRTELLQSARDGRLMLVSVLRRADPPPADWQKRIEGVQQKRPDGTYRWRFDCPRCSVDAQFREATLLARVVKANLAGLDIIDVSYNKAVS